MIVRNMQPSGLLGSACRRVPSWRGTRPCCAVSAGAQQLNLSLEAEHTGRPESASRCRVLQGPGWAVEPVGVFFQKADVSFSPALRLLTTAGTLVTSQLLLPPP